MLNEQRYEVEIKTHLSPKPIVKTVSARDEESAIEMVKANNPDIQDTDEITVRGSKQSFGPNNKPTNDGVNKPNPLGEGRKKKKVLVDPETMEKVHSTVESRSTIKLQLDVDYARRLAGTLAENGIEVTYSPKRVLSNIIITNDGSVDFSERYVQAVFEADTTGHKYAKQILGIKS